MSTSSNRYGLFGLAAQRIKRDRLAIVCLGIMLGFLLMVLLSATGFIASTWNEEVAESYAPPSFTVSTATPAAATAHTPPPAADLGERLAAHKRIEDDLARGMKDPIAEAFKEAKQYAQTHTQPERPLAKTLPFGADRWGRDVVAKTLRGAQTSLWVGLGAAMLATFIGVVLGMLAGYCGGMVDALCDWLYSLMSAVPYLLFILAIAAVLGESGVKTMIIIFGLTGWTGVYRQIRAETLRQRSREYLRAAEAMGVSHFDRLMRHILPNTNHIILVQLSILTVAFIKSEVILSFLGFGVPVSEVSWGSMLNEAQSELLLGIWWQLLAATLAMALLITAWSLFTDAMRDALDPKIK